MARGILLEQRLIPCLLHQQADSLLPSSPGSACALPGLSGASESRVCPEVLVVQELSHVHLFVTPRTKVLPLCFTPSQLSRVCTRALILDSGGSRTYRHAHLNTAGVTLHVLFPEACFCLLHVTHILTNEFPMVFHTVSEACTAWRTQAPTLGSLHTSAPPLTWLCLLPLPLFSPSTVS